MNTSRHRVLGSIILCAVSHIAHTSEPSARVVISEGDYIGYSTVAEALKTLKAQGHMPLPGIDGAPSFIEPDHRTTWTFVTKNSPAYPSTVRYAYTRTGGSVLHIEITILCEAAETQCEIYRRKMRENATQESKMLAGDPSVKCWVNDTTMKCGSEPIRKQTNQHVYTYVGDDGNCRLDSVVTQCIDIGKKIREEHPSDDPKVSVCAIETTKYDAVGKALGALTEGAPFAGVQLPTVLAQCFR